MTEIWTVVGRLPCAVRLLPIPKGSAGFYDFDEYERLVDAAKALDPNSYLIVLLGGEAGLRCGEMIGLEWRGVEIRGGQLCIQRSDWRGHVTAPKSGRARYVPMTSRLATALRDHRHLRGPRVVGQRDGSPLTHNMVGFTGWVTRSVLDSRCAVPQRERFKSWRGTKISSRRSGTCIF